VQRFRIAVWIIEGVHDGCRLRRKTEEDLHDGHSRFAQLVTQKETLELIWLATTSSSRVIGSFILMGWLGGDGGRKAGCRGWAKAGEEWQIQSRCIACDPRSFQGVPRVFFRLVLTIMTITGQMVWADSCERFWTCYRLSVCGNKWGEKPVPWQTCFICYYLDSWRSWPIGIVYSTTVGSDQFDTIKKRKRLVHIWEKV
jgi:hypothetical protein